MKKLSFIYRGAIGSTVFRDDARADEAYAAVAISHETFCAAQDDLICELYERSYRLERRFEAV